ncbi:MAG: HAMP domain-containing histidine kinase [Labilithrix sp.]|nr:HAMP domain-containing histidine kinase [Labilithrix sp.]
MARNVLSTSAVVMTSSSLLHAPMAVDGAPESANGEALEHLRTELLRRIGHDIASPAGVTLTVLEELATSGEPRPELVAMARRSLRRLMRLSEQLALVAELESGAVQPELSATDLRALTRQAVDEALAIDGRKDVVASCDLPSTALLVAADPRMLLMVFREVIGNALKLASSRVHVSLEAKGGEIAIRVDDDGPGFPEEALTTLGRRFVRRSAARGLGLSLSMGIEILRAHGGTLAVEASTLPPGRRGTAGAAVVLTLPATSNDV